MQFLRYVGMGLVLVAGLVIGAIVLPMLGIAEFFNPINPLLGFFLE